MPGVERGGGCDMFEVLAESQLHQPLLSVLYLVHI